MTQLERTNTLYSIHNQFAIHKRFFHLTDRTNLVYQLINVPNILYNVHIFYTFKSKLLDQKTLVIKCKVSKLDVIQQRFLLNLKNLKFLLEVAQDIRIAFFMK